MWLFSCAQNVYLFCLIIERVESFVVSGAVAILVKSSAWIDKESRRIITEYLLADVMTVWQVYSEVRYLAQVDREMYCIQLLQLPCIHPLL